MADDEDGPEIIGEHASRQVAQEHDVVPNQEMAIGDDWATTMARTRLRSGRAWQETSQEECSSSTQSFRESQGLVRCSIKENVIEKEKPQKRKRKGKGKAKSWKPQNSDLVVANTKLPTDSSDIKRSCGQPSEQAIVLETQSTAVPESLLSVSNSG